MSSDDIVTPVFLHQPASQCYTIRDAVERKPALAPFWKPLPVEGTNVLTLDEDAHGALLRFADGRVEHVTPAVVEALGIVHKIAAQAYRS